MRCRQRDRVAEGARQRVAVTDQEEGQVQRDEQIDDEPEGDLADAQRLRGDELAAAHQRVGQTPLQRVEVDESETVEPGRDPVGQGIEDAAEVARRTQSLRVI